MKDPACRVAPERGGPSRKRRPSPSSGTATKRRRTRAVQNQSNIIERISPRSGRTRTAPLHGATPAGRPARGPVGQRASGQERGKRACGSAQKRRTPRSAKRGAECDLRNSRSFAAGRQDRACAMRSLPKAETRLAARWSKPRRRGCVIERGAGMPAGASFACQFHLIGNVRRRRAAWSTSYACDRQLPPAQPLRPQAPIAV